MGFLFALLRRKGSSERQKAGSNPKSATSAPGPGGAGSVSAPLERGRDPCSHRNQENGAQRWAGEWMLDRASHRQPQGRENATLMETSDISLPR